MKRYRYLSAICLVAAALFSACTQDELTEQGTALSEGQYPLRIGGITISSQGEASPQTRVSENANGSGSVFESGDIIGVRIGNSEETGEYQLSVDANGSVTGTTVVTPVFWQNTSPAVINAWYTTASASTPNTVILRDQSSDLAYVLKGRTTNEVSYQTTNIQLSFTHQLAKVRVRIQQTGSQTAINKVEIYNYTQCTHTQGTVTTAETDRGWITMYHDTGNDVWEANVVPGTVNGTALIRLNDTGKNDGTTVDITGINEFVTGSLHEITVSLVEVIRGNGYTIIPSTHTITLDDGTSLNTEMIDQAMGTTGTLVINGTISESDMINLNLWGNYSNRITSLTLTNVTSILSEHFIMYLTNLQYLDLPNATNIGDSSLPIFGNLKKLKLTTAEDITFHSNAIPSYRTSGITLTLNENKQDEVTNGNQWGGFTWAAIEFE